MQVNIRHAIAAAIIVATLLITGTVASLLQSDTPPGRAASQTPVATATPACTLGPEFEGLIPLPPECVTPEGE